MSEDLLDTGSANSVRHAGNGHAQQNLPNSGGILTMGILSIVLAGVFGIILGIISLSLSGAAEKTYRQNPEKFREGSYRNMRAGKVCSIIGVSLTGLVIFIAVLANL